MHTKQRLTRHFLQYLIASCLGLLISLSSAGESNACRDFGIGSKPVLHLPSCSGPYTYPLTALPITFTCPNYGLRAIWGFLSGDDVRKPMFDDAFDPCYKSLALTSLANRTEREYTSRKWEQYFRRDLSDLYYYVPSAQRTPVRNNPPQ